MEWTPQLEKSLRDGTSTTASGTSCYFVALTETTGIKLYGTKLERDASYVALSVAAEHGLAPKVGQCVDLNDLEIHSNRPDWWPRDFKPKTLYGFLTEIANPDSDSDYSELRELESGLHEVFGKYVSDIGGTNVGRTADGTLVAIDIDGRFSGLLSRAEIESVNQAWGGNYWHL